MSNIIPITNTINIRKSRTNNQSCLFCGRNMNKEWGVIFTNKGDDITLRKNLWCHYRCMVPLGKLLVKKYKETKIEAIANFV